MRKIIHKYRYWCKDPDNPFMEYVDLITLSQFLNKYTDEYIRKFEIMQFTSLSDSKGKDIYEADILWANDKHWKVGFSGGGFVAWGPGRWKAIPNLYQPIITGNIWENSEFLHYK